MAVGVGACERRRLTRAAPNGKTAARLERAAGAQAREIGWLSLHRLSTAWGVDFLEMLPGIGRLFARQTDDLAKSTASLLEMAKIGEPYGIGK